ncbi:META domain-containing protein [Salinimicrobium xinjiangense]|uniref:META domain-containing protein n=1 Tax=Salinimicrobium xinjiangense TaxID=438596 RepID=UPI0004231457|nr:META domain-containing protein [Salinimicrobium xinjiangense]
MKNFLLLFFSLILLSCANTADTVTDESLDGDYQISEIDGQKIVSEKIILEFNPIGNRVSGNTGCNQFSAHYNQHGNNLEFSTPMNTRKHCEGKMEMERQILSSLEKVSRLNRTGQEIFVYSINNEPLFTLIKID